MCLRKIPSCASRHTARLYNKGTKVLNTDDVIRDIASKQLNVPMSEKDIARSHRITPMGGSHCEICIVQRQTASVRSQS